MRKARSNAGLLAFLMGLERCQDPGVTFECDVSRRNQPAAQRPGPKFLRSNIGVGHCDMPSTRMRLKDQIECRPADAPAPIGTEHEEFCHEPAGLSASQRAFVYDQRETGNLFP